MTKEAADVPARGEGELALRVCATGPRSPCPSGSRSRRVGAGARLVLGGRDPEAGLERTRSPAGRHRGHGGRHQGSPRRGAGLPQVAAQGPGAGRAEAAGGRRQPGHLGGGPARGSGWNPTADAEARAGGGDPRYARTSRGHGTSSMPATSWHPDLRLPGTGGTDERGREPVRGGAAAHLRRQAVQEGRASGSRSTGAEGRLRTRAETRAGSGWLLPRPTRRWLFRDRDGSEVIGSHECESGMAFVVLQ